MIHMYQWRAHVHGFRLTVPDEWNANSPDEAGLLMNSSSGGIAPAGDTDQS
jgi:hypothetical protein